ncbi:MAG TPA: hypothetical protein VGW77_20820 [Candidatus Binatia bacterium]|jgi:hypothetical protein|nr:hypothetical protein [Candidatus Binatia bacterium]
MKRLPGTSSQSTPGFRKKCEIKQVPAEIHQIAHNLFNQLSVINLCSFKLRGAVPDHVGPAVANDLQTLERAVEDATLLAEELSQAIAALAAISEAKAPRLVKAPPQNNNVLPLFAASRRPR